MRTTLTALVFLLATSLGAQETSAAASADEFSKAVFFGKKFFELKDYAAAYDQFAKADSLNPDQPGVIYNMAVVLAKAGRYSDAQVKVDRYLQLFPNGTERPAIAQLQLELDFQRELQKKRQADQNYADLFNRGQFLYARNELAEALKLFQEAEQQRPSDPAAIYNQAVIHEKLGELPKAVERFQRYAELESDSDRKTAAGQRIFALQNEIEDMRTKIVCSFCGLKLPGGATWCHRCWHGPYTASSAVWNSRPCVEGASATRAMYYSDGRFAKNDSLSCVFPGGTMRDAIRYSAARQRAIQETRKAEGWTYRDDVIQEWTDKQGAQIRYHQGPEYLEKITSSGGGEILTYAAHQAGGAWLLDREEVMIDGAKHAIRYTFDGSNRVVQQAVEYQNVNACNHLVSMTADYTYEGDALTGAKLSGGYDGYAPEGLPKVAWQAAVTYAYDAKGRLAKEDLAITSFEKTYMQRPVGAYRDEIGRLYVSMRVKRPIENAIRIGDVCATAGNLLLGNEIDLRPFYLLSPNLAIQIPRGVTRATVSFTYPESFAIR